MICLVGRAQNCCKTSYNTQESPDDHRKYLAPNGNSGKSKKSLARYIGSVFVFIRDNSFGEIWTSLVAQLVKNMFAMKETWVGSLG